MVVHLKYEALMNALLARGGQSFYQLGPQLCIGFLLRWRSVDFFLPCGALVVKPRDLVIEFCSLMSDASLREFSGLGQSHGWLFGPKWGKPYGHSG
jgi:hypothetical protein